MNDQLLELMKEKISQSEVSMAKMLDELCNQPDQPLTLRDRIEMLRDSWGYKVMWPLRRWWWHVPCVFLGCDYHFAEWCDCDKCQNQCARCCRRKP